jgi:hypothetical protein
MIKWLQEVYLSWRLRVLPEFDGISVCQAKGRGALDVIAKLTIED